MYMELPNPPFDELEYGDIIYDRDKRKAGRIGRVSRRNPDVEVEWFTGDGGRTEHNVSKLLEKINDKANTTFVLVAHGEEKKARTQQLLEGFSEGFKNEEKIEYSQGDSIETYLIPDRYLEQAVLYRWCDHTGELTVTGARLASYISQIINAFDVSRMNDVLARESVSDFLDRAKSHRQDPVLVEASYEILEKMWDETDFYRVYKYDKDQINIKFPKDESEKAEETLLEFQKNGFVVRFKEDKRYKDNKSPNTLTVDLTTVPSSVGRKMGLDF